MTIKLVKRYYCDHCRKGGMTKAIADHERACIKNPERICPICEEFSFEQVPMPELLAAAAESLKDLQALTDCPACTLAALAQRRISNPEEDWKEFDYKEEMLELRASRIDSLYSQE